MHYIDCHIYCFNFVYANERNDSKHADHAL
jgi:hypothetical protein